MVVVTGPCQLTAARPGGEPPSAACGRGGMVPRAGVDRLQRDFLIDAVALRSLSPAQSAPVKWNVTGFGSIK